MDCKPAGFDREAHALTTMFMKIWDVHVWEGSNQARSSRRFVGPKTTAESQTPVNDEVMVQCITASSTAGLKNKRLCICGTTTKGTMKRVTDYRQNSVQRLWRNKNARKACCPHTTLYRSKQRPHISASFAYKPVTRINNSLQIE